MAAGVLRRGLLVLPSLGQAGIAHVLQAGGGVRWLDYGTLGMRYKLITLYQITQIRLIQTLQNNTAILVLLLQPTMSLKPSRVALWKAWKVCLTPASADTGPLSVGLADSTDGVMSSTSPLPPPWSHGSH